MIFKPERLIVVNPPAKSCYWGEKGVVFFMASLPVMEKGFIIAQQSNEDKFMRTTQLRF